MVYFRSFGALVFVSLCFSPQVKAFTVWQEGSFVTSGWQVNAIGVDLDSSCTSNTAVSAALAAAVATWNNIPTANLSVGMGTTRSLPNAITAYTGTTVSQQYIGRPLIYCDTSFDRDFSLTSPSNIPGLELAPTLNCVGSSTYCAIQGGLVVLNADTTDLSNVSNLSPTILSVVVAHELGHALGLGHSADVNALMYYNATAKTQLRLAQDDVDAISYLYPRNELHGDKVFGCGSLAVLESGNSGPRSGSGKKSTNDFGCMAEFVLLISACFGISVVLKTKTSVHHVIDL